MFKIGDTVVFDKYFDVPGEEALWGNSDSFAESGYPEIEIYIREKMMYKITGYHRGNNFNRGIVIEHIGGFETWSVWPENIKLAVPLKKIKYRTIKI
jgi:hypothetical protein